MGLLGRKVSVYIVLLDIAKFTYKNFVFSPAISEECRFLPQLCQEYAVKHFTFCQSDKWEIIHQYSSHLHFFYYEWTEYLFLNMLAIFNIYFGEFSVCLWRLISIGFLVLFILNFKSHFCVRDIKPLPVVYIINIFTVWSFALNFAYGIFFAKPKFLFNWSTFSFITSGRQITVTKTFSTHWI